MRPFYFGTSQKALLGIHHPPLAKRPRACGVVLCHPMGQEYIHCHRAFRQLAIHLAQAGFDVLRFDFYGCGDSAGDGDQGNIDQWLADIGTAISEIKDAAGLTKAFLVGARLGATLAALAGTQRSDLRGVVLWEPIVDGKAYVEELLRMHQKWLRDTLPKPGPSGGNSGDHEILGFPLTHALRGGLEKIDLSALKQRPAKNVFIIESDRESATLPLRNRLDSLDVHTDYQYVAAPKIWTREGDFNGVLVPMQIVQAIVSWTSNVTL